MKENSEVKQDWQITGVVVGTDSTISSMSAIWVGLTHEEAEAKMEQMLRAEMKKKRVHGVRIEAISLVSGGYALIQRAESK